MVVVLFFEAMALIIPVGVAVVAIRRGAEINLFWETTVVVGPEDWWKSILVALGMLVVFSYLNALLAAGQASLLRLICGPRQRELERNVERLTRSRAALVTGFEVERRRIERDLHDGVQQELVTLAARLGMLDLELDDLAEGGARTDGARRALSAAQGQAERAMSTLRDTVRGIHPAVLTDHGLHAALTELSGRSPVAIDLDLAGLPRFSSAAETAGYYLVTEALTNTAKHTTAERILVRGRVDGSLFTLTVADDGHGGADEEAGTGLRGLRERAETLGGELAVESPPGGPTVLRMTLPVTKASTPDALLSKDRRASDAPAAR
jgi:signal transduction histidine kinase